MNYKLPNAATVFAALAKMVRREARRPKRAARRVSHMEQQRRAVAGARRRRERLQREAQARAALRQKSERMARRAPWRGKPTMVEQMTAVMEPGKWYGARDIAEMSGVAIKSTRATLIQKLLARGLVERVRNPEWTPGVPNPRELMAGAEVEPVWLYRLTAEGEARQSAQKKTGA